MAFEAVNKGVAVSALFPGILTFGALSYHVRSSTLRLSCCEEVKPCAEVRQSPPRWGARYTRVSESPGDSKSLPWSPPSRHLRNQGTESSRQLRALSKFLSH